MPKMTGSQYIAESFKGYGVTHAFLVPAILRKTLVEMDKRGIRPIVTHGEKAAAYMADGYARASHRIGVCMAQSVGAANLAAVRRLALSLLRQEKTNKRGLKNKRLACALDPNYLLTVLANARF